MTADGLLVLQFVCTSIWQLFTCWYIPGTNVTPAELGVFVLFCSVVLKFANHLMPGLILFGLKEDKKEDKDV